MNFEFNLDVPAFPQVSLSSEDQAFHDRALLAAKSYKLAEADILQIDCEVDATGCFDLRLNQVGADSPHYRGVEGVGRSRIPSKSHHVLFLSSSAVAQS